MNKIKAIHILLGILSIVIVFHLLILTEVIPYTVVWAGRIKTLDEMFVFEMVSILINILLVVILLKKKKNLKEERTVKYVDITLWVFAFLFALNTIGNLFSQSKVELFGGTALTLVSSYMCYYIVRE